MKIIFGPYGCELTKSGISSNMFAAVQRGQQKQYRLAVEKIARAYIEAGATLPTINGFFLRSLLQEGCTHLYKEMLQLNLEALLTALGNSPVERIALCLGPARDCYRPDCAPDVESAKQFACLQYELCLEVLDDFGSNIFFLHETIGTAREALGISLAAKSLNIPLVISFIVDRAGRLLSKESIDSVIFQIDRETDHFIEGYSLNCCSPLVVYSNPRIIGFYPNSYNANPCSYEAAIIKNKEPHKMDSLRGIFDYGHKHHLGFVGGCCGFGNDDIKLLAQLNENGMGFFSKRTKSI